MKTPQVAAVEVPLAAPLEFRNVQGNLFLTLSYKQDFFVAKWWGHITAEDVVVAAKAFLELALSMPCPKLLNDKSEVTGDWQEANDWIEFEWLPAVVEAGLKCMAHIYSQDMMTSSSEHDLYKRAAPQLQLGKFTETTAAEAWLAGCSC